MKSTDIRIEKFEEDFYADVNTMFIKPINYVEVPKEYNYNTEFPTWIIAYCPDSDSWFVTNNRFFYYEYDREFKTEKDGIEYFRNNVPDFFELTRKLSFRRSNGTRVFLENTKEEYRDWVEFDNVQRLKELKIGISDEE